MITSTTILGDWGTSQLRLYLCKDGKISDVANGPGIGKIQVDAVSVLLDSIKSWQQHHKIDSMYLCGMAGSSLGLADVPHQSCPSHWQAIGQSAQSTEINGVEIHIVPGLACTNPLGASDYLRGEESQLVGAVATGQVTDVDSALLCLCGTHTKWVWMDSGIVKTFLTSLAGELYSVLLETVLVENHESNMNFPEVFTQGVSTSDSHAQSELLHTLFQARSRRLNGEIAADSAPDFLSGLIIGADVKNALEISRAIAADPKKTIIIGKDSVASLYREACSHYLAPSQILDGQYAVLGGLRSIFELDIDVESYVSA